MYTLNNPTEQLDPSDWPYVPDYVVWQKEEMQSVHFQGYACWSRQLLLTGAKKCLPRAHWEKRQGTHAQAKIYCQKEESRIEGPFEFGDESSIPIKPGQRSDLRSFVQICKEAKGKLPEKVLLESHTAIVARYPKFVDRVKRAYTEQRMWEMDIVCLIGPTGVGKTRWAYEHYPDLYSVPMKKSGLTYWDGYDQQDVVLIDEMGGDRLSYRSLLQLLDRYPAMVPVHGSQIPFVSKMIILTSNTHPRDWYPNVSVNSPFEESPLERRMTQNRSRIIDIDGDLTVPSKLHMLYE